MNLIENKLILIKKINTIPYNTISLSDFESDQNQRSNLDGLESESSMIGFVTPNCLSLVPQSGQIHFLFWDRIP